MLQRLRDQTQSTGFKIIVAVLVFALAFFGFGAFNVFAPGDPAVASVNGDDITQGALLQETEREKRFLLMEGSESADLDPLQVQSRALERLVTRTLLEQIVEDLDLAAAPSRVNAAVVADPGFQIDGQFNSDLYRRGLSAMGFTPTDYMAALAKQMSSDQLRLAISDSVFATDWETRSFARLMDQKRDLAWLPFTVTHFGEGVAVDAAQVETYYEEHRTELMTEETVDAAYVELAWDQMLDDPAIEVTEADLEREHAADKAAAEANEQRRSSHILLRFGDERTEAQAIALLEDISGRIAAGESFAELAQTYSEDPGSAQLGGDLGAVGQGIFDPDFEAALWALEVGELSVPVKSAFGYHLIRLDGIEAVEFPAFSERRAILEERLRRAAAEALFTERMRELDSLAFENNDSLTAVAEALGLEVQRVEGISRTIGDAVFANADIREALFAADVLLDGNNTAALEYGANRAVVARVDEHHASVLKALDEVRPQIEALLVERTAQARLAEAFDAALARVRAGDGVAAVADEHGLAWQTLEAAGRTDPRPPPEVAEAAFALSRPEAGGKSVGAAALGAGGKAIVTVTRVVEGDVSALADSELDGLRELFVTRSETLDYEALYQGYLADADISRRIAPSD
ncbi:MAG: SurA N-terminal domain-containing protein [Gammaproteobacteria bacterium]|nr:SurA N-terminal domain-containing protein [Gammaproteobacteria bacterium]MCY4344507.1 SurA N-terminal domain-containing protein [Gammaproteobacteria bacterium]